MRSCCSSGTGEMTILIPCTMRRPQSHAGTCADARGWFEAAAGMVMVSPWIDWKLVQYLHTAGDVSCGPRDGNSPADSLAFSFAT